LGALAALWQFFVAIVLVGFFLFVAPLAIYIFAKCFTGRGWTFMNYNPDEHP
jgi:hypothetical protein